MKVDSTQIRIVFSFNEIFIPVPQKSTSLPSKKVNSTRWPMFRSAREYMQTCVFFKILQNTVQLSINNFISKHLSTNKYYINCRRKLHSIKSERFEGVYWKHWWKISVYTSVFFRYDETFSRPDEQNDNKMPTLSQWIIAILITIKKHYQCFK